MRAATSEEESSRAQIGLLHHRRHAFTADFRSSLMSFVKLSKAISRHFDSITAGRDFSVSGNNYFLTSYQKVLHAPPMHVVSLSKVHRGKRRLIGQLQVFSDSIRTYKHAS
jgi:hypothetical protein